MNLVMVIWRCRACLDFFFSQHDAHVFLLTASDRLERLRAYLKRKLKRRDEPISLPPPSRYAFLVLHSALFLSRGWCPKGAENCFAFFRFFYNPIVFILVSHFNPPRISSAFRVSLLRSPILASCHFASASCPFASCPFALLPLGLLPPHLCLFASFIRSHRSSLTGLWSLVSSLPPGFQVAVPEAKVASQLKGAIEMQARYAAGLEAKANAHELTLPDSGEAATLG